MKITLYGKPATKKNSPVLIGGRVPRMIPSKAYREYERCCLKVLAMDARAAWAEPVNVACVYFMPDKRTVDLNNLLEATTDILVKAGILPDDSCLHIHSHDGSRVRYDKDNPRVEITITASGEAQPWTPTKAQEGR